MRFFRTCNEKKKKKNVGFFGWYFVALWCSAQSAEWKIHFDSASEQLELLWTAKVNFLESRMTKDNQRAFFRTSLLF